MPSNLVRRRKKLRNDTEILLLDAELHVQGDNIPDAIRLTEMALKNLKAITTEPVDKKGKF